MISCLLQVRRGRWGPCFPFLHNHIADEESRATFPTLMSPEPALLPLTNRITSTVLPRQGGGSALPSIADSEGLAQLSFLMAPSPALLSAPEGKGQRDTWLGF